MTEIVRIERVGHRGDGIAETESGRLLVPFTLPGERVEIERAGERGVLKAIVERSSERIDPVCKHFGVCGGCAAQHWNANAYLAWKRDLVVSALRRANIETNISAIIDAHGAGRRRIVLHTAPANGGYAVGFAARRSHEIVAIEECPILSPELAGAVSFAREIANIVRPSKKPLDIQITTTLGGLDIDLRNIGKLSSKTETELVKFASARKLARLSRESEPIAAVVEPAINIGAARVVLPPASFLQATEAGESALAARVVAAAEDAKHAADLFCGVGAFALRLAETMKVDAFDTNAGAIAALTKAGKTPGLKPVNAQARDLFRWPLLSKELKNYDFIVLDPPRQGAEAQARELATAKIRRIAYVSCEPETFARDAAILISGGYKLTSVTPVDQFRYSAHVELAGIFER